MEEVGVLAEAVAVLLDLIQVLALFHMHLLPVLIAVVRLGALESAQDMLVLVSNTCDLFYANRAIE